MGRIKSLLMDAEENGFSFMSKGEKSACPNHFEDQYLIKTLRKKEEDGVCSYCGVHGKVVDLSYIANHIAFVLSQYYDNPDREDLPLAGTFFDDNNEVIPGIKRVGAYAAPSEAEDYEDTQEMMDDNGCLTDNEELNNDLINVFYDQQWIKKDAFEPWKDDRLSMQWKSFSEAVKHTCRYTFLANGSEKSDSGPLSEILYSLGEIISSNDIFKLLNEDTVLYRARGLKPSDKDTGKFDEITSPPDKVAGQCRMSPAGVSMFYAAFDKDTILKECIHSEEDDRFMIGAFHPIRPLRVLDLTSLPIPSIWMTGWEGVSFLHSFHKDITQPLSDKDRADVDYIPSQVFTEYLRLMFKDKDDNKIDGLIYNSSKVGSKNIVLFYNQEQSHNVVKLISSEIIPK